MLRNTKSETPRRQHRLVLSDENKQFHCSIEMNIASKTSKKKSFQNFLTASRIKIDEKMFFVIICPMAEIVRDIRE